MAEPKTDKPPETEKGTALPLFAGITPWSSWSGGDDIEKVAELQWPNSTYTYAYMMNDSQIMSLIHGLLLPIRAFRYYLEPNGAPPSAVERISKNYNLPIGLEDEFQRRRAQRRFSFDKHIEDALRAVWYGHMCFEQVGEVAEGYWNLRKLAIRPPRTISEIQVARDGSLEWIRQHTMGYDEPPLRVNRLVWYAWDREGANWTGRSMLRSVYRNHLAKDRVMRVGAINIERAGGVPYVEAPEGATGPEIRELDAMARRFRVGEAAGAAIPHGAQLKFAAAAGGDGAVQYIKLQNEEMARSFLQMVSMLGQTNSGSRALGGTFQDIAQVAQYTIAKWLCDTFNEHVIEDDVEWNEGPLTEFAPLLKFDAGAQDPMEGFQEADGEDDGLQVEDPELRAAYGLDPAGSRHRRPRKSRARAMREDSTRRGSSVEAAAGGTGDGLASQVSLPARSLRRQPYQHEIEAAVDYQLIDSAYEAALVNLQNEVRMARSFQIDQLHDAIVEANGDVRATSEINTDVSASERIRLHLEMVAQTAMDAAVQEANRQGIDIPRQSVEEIRPILQARAEAIDTLIRRDMVQSASREAVRLSGGGLSATEVADETSVFLQALVGAAMLDMLGGAIQSSINEGRKLVFQRDGRDGTLFASEILDSNTCSECIAVDGRQYMSFEDAERDYPSGHFKDCKGRERCRGMVVKVYVRDRETVEEPAL